MGTKSKFSLEGVGEGFTEELAFELDLQELSKCKRRKVSPSPAEYPAGVTRYIRCLEEWQIPYVQSKADRTTVVV